MDNKEFIRDAHLLAYLDGELDPETAAQIEASPELQARVQSLARFEARLKRGLFRLDCPDGLQLTEYAAGRLPIGQHETINRHLHSCPHCSAELITIRDFLNETKEDLEPSLVTRIRVLVARLLTPLRDVRASAVLRDAGAGD